VRVVSLDGTMVLVARGLVGSPFGERFEGLEGAPLFDELDGGVHEGFAYSTALLGGGITRIALAPNSGSGHFAG